MFSTETNIALPKLAHFCLSLLDINTVIVRSYSQCFRNWIMKSSKTHVGPTLINLIIPNITKQVVRGLVQRNVQCSKPNSYCTVQQLMRVVLLQEQHNKVFSAKLPLPQFSHIRNDAYGRL